MMVVHSNAWTIWKVKAGDELLTILRVSADSELCDMVSSARLIVHAHVALRLD